MSGQLTPRPSPYSVAQRYAPAIAREVVKGVYNHGGKAVSKAWKAYSTMPPIRPPGLRQSGANKRLRMESGDADIITTQHDTKLRYMKGKQSKKAKSRVRFMKKVRKAVFSDIGLRSYVQDDGGAVINCALNELGYSGVIMGDIQQAAGVAGSDILNAFRVAFENVSGTSASFINRKVYIKSICIDLHLKNTGSTTMELDVYQLVMRKDFSFNVPIGTMFQNTWAYAQTGAGFGSAVVNPGVTPFQNSTFCEHWKILSRRSVLLGSQQVSTLQLRGRGRIFDGNILTRNVMGVPGFTKAYLIVHRGSPENNLGTARRGAAELTWVQERTMTLARHSDGQNQDVTVTV